MTSLNALAAALDAAVMDALVRRGYRSPEHLDALAVLADALEESGDYAGAAMTRLQHRGYSDGPGHWRKDSEFVVSLMLEKLPRDMPAAAKRKAVNAAYPWGRRAHHPLKIWRKVVREMLAPTARRQATGDEPAGPLFG